MKLSSRRMERSFFGKRNKQSQITGPTDNAAVKWIIYITFHCLCLFQWMARTEIELDIRQLDIDGENEKQYGLLFWHNPWKFMLNMRLFSQSRSSTRFKRIFADQLVVSIHHKSSRRLVVFWDTIIPSYFHLRHKKQFALQNIKCPKV